MIRISREIASSVFKIHTFYEYDAYDGYDDDYDHACYDYDYDHDDYDDDYYDYHC